MSQENSPIYWQNLFNQLSCETNRSDCLLTLLTQGIDASSDFILWLDQAGRILFANRAFCQRLEYSEQELCQMHIYDVDSCITDQEIWCQYWQKLRHYQKNGHHFSSNLCTKSGQKFSVDVNAQYVVFNNKEYCFAVLRHASISSAGYVNQLALIEAIEQAHTHLIYLLDEHQQIRYVNRKLIKLTEFSPEEVLNSHLYLVKPDHSSTDLIADEVWDALRTGHEWKGECLHRHKSGELFWCQASISPVRRLDTEILHCLVILEDISDRKRNEANIQHLAFYDPLTDLPNRRLFRDRLTQAAVGSNRTEIPFALVYLDLDHFKEINDTLGHHTGDALLKNVAERMSICLREGDTVARLGGDEFSLIINNVMRLEDVRSVAKRVMERLNQPFEHDGREFYITTSIGISIYPINTSDVDTLIKQADIAMYRSKTSGRNQMHFYSEEMAADALERLTLELQLQKAVENDEFFLTYQPTLDLHTGKVIGLEALIRWQHPQLGLVSPARFIPLTEETGLIIKIGRWILRHACAQNKKWQEQGLPPVRVSVNLSAIQFKQRNLLDLIQEVLRETKLDPKWLELELTEASIIDDMSYKVETLKSLQRLGVSLAIDDFGTGFSNLSYLKHFPIDRIKIDSSFISAIPESKNDMAITKAMIAMCHSLGLRVTAEGVETEVQLDFLKNHLCDEIQGFIFSRPLSAEDVNQLLKTSA